MALSVNTNLSALTAQRNMLASTDRLGSSLEKLSTGLKINKARDNAAGLVTSEFQRAQINGLTKGIENIDKANSLVQTAESAIGEISALLTNVRALTAESANNGALDSNALSANQAEIENLLDTIDNIASRTKFGTVKLLDGTAGLRGTTTQITSVKFLRATETSVADGSARPISVTRNAQRAIVTNAGTTTGVSIGGATATVAANGTRQTAALGQDETLTINGVDIYLAAGLNQTAVINRINEYKAQTGVEAATDGTRTALLTTEFGSAAKVEVFSNRTATSTSTGFGTGLTSESGIDVQGTIGGQASTGLGRVLTGQFGTTSSGISIEIAVSSAQGNVSTSVGLGNVTVVNASRTFQIGAFSGETAQLAIIGASSSQLGIGVVGSRFQKLRDIQVGTSAQANEALNVVDEAINDITNLRGRLGAFQNQTLGATQSTLRTQLERLQEAESIVRDTDFASEIAKFTNEQIRQQSTTAILGLANQQSQGILSLLRG